MAYIASATSYISSKMHWEIRESSGKRKLAQQAVMLLVFNLKIKRHGESSWLLVQDQQGTVLVRPNISLRNKIQNIYFCIIGKYNFSSKNIVREITKEDGNLKKEWGKVKNKEGKLFRIYRLAFLVAKRILSDIPLSGGR